jgi:phosphate-selective porin OprO and OprP
LIARTTTHTSRAPVLLLALSILARLAGAAEPAAEPTATPTPTPTPVKQTPARTFSIQSADGDFRMRVGGYMQGDARFYADDAATVAPDTFLMRRAYLILQGDLGRLVSFYVSPDFGDGKASLEDGYADLKFSSSARLRVGKMKSPFGLEHLQSSMSLLFVERFLPTSLSPNRDVGVLLTGDLASAVLNYSAGVLNGAPDGASVDRDAAGDGKEAVGRLFVRPFQKRKGALDLGFGLAATFGSHDGALATYKSPGQQPIFSYATGVIAEGDRWRIAPQGYAYYRTVGLMAEWTRSAHDLRKDQATLTARHDAWGVSASWVITGGKPSYASFKPQRSFDPRAHAWGALELAARYGKLKLDDRVFAASLADRAKSVREAAAVGLGLNWIVTENLKYQVNFERTKFKDGATAGSRKSENVFLVRAQLAF